MGIRQDEAGKPVFEKDINSAEQWVKAQDELARIGAGKTHEMSFIVSPPKGASPGSHYVGLMIEAVKEKEAPVGLSASLASILVLQISGTAKEKVDIVGWSVNKNEAEVLSFELGLKNNGNVEVPLEGMLYLKNWKGEKILEKKISLGNVLLASSDRSLNVRIAYKEAGISSTGLYKAGIVIKYGLTGQAVDSQISFWHFEKWLLFGFLMLGILPAVLILRVKFRRTV